MLGVNINDSKHKPDNVDVRLTMLTDNQIDFKLSTLCVFNWPI